eukprot:TRINITY_DN15774_c0_g1_i1.p1 TRINITY_DN15774_c0_g1~~TRINITY_DN15774_c0_g1_i1.p1  ORF type:complete len:358 (+),score=38.72 TRINITY_DN15774_c0_g1_i1:68-1141(+)
MAEITPKSSTPLVKREGKNCSKCSKSFGPFTWSYNCTACGDIFCDDCSKYYILLPPEFGFTQTTRVCHSCVLKHSSIDYSRTYDVFEPHGTPQGTPADIVLVGGALGSRAQLTYIAENLCEKHRVITVDLPGQGGRYKEALSRPAAVAVLKEIVENHTIYKKAIVIGISMGGYVAMQFAGENPDLVSALILHGCHNESSGAMASVLYGMMGMVYKVLSREKLSNLVPETFPKIPRDRMEKSFLRTMLDYDQWPACAEVMKEPREGFNVEMLSRYQGPVLFIRGDGDFARSEEKFLAACKNGRKVIIVGGSHVVPYEEPGSKEWHDHVLKFIEDTESLPNSITEKDPTVRLSTLNFQN